MDKSGTDREDRDVTLGSAPLYASPLAPSVSEGLDLAAPSRLPVFELDTTKYLPQLADEEGTDAQKVAFLLALTDIMRRWVELGWDVKICGQLLDRHNIASSGETVGVESQAQAIGENERKQVSND